MLRIQLFSVGVLVLLACKSPNGDLAQGDGGGTPAATDIDGGTSPGTSAGDGCPAYQRLCGGACIPTSMDPQNCGGCGVVCAAGKVCSSGACSDTCLPGLTACAQTCVDADSDNAHCGACGHSCAAGEGCVSGSCVAGVPTSGVSPASCVGGSAGPPLQVSTGTTTTCAGQLAQTTFRWGLCSCSSIGHSGELRVDGFDSAAGPYVPGGLGGGVGLNGEYGTSGDVHISGAFFSSDAKGLGFSSAIDVGLELHFAGPVTGSGSLSVGADAYVGGDVYAGSGGTVTGKLFTPEATMVKNIVASSVVRQPVSVAPPCDCAADKLIPVQQIVAQGKLHNDNATLGLDPAVMATGSDPRRLDLPCGSYYLTGVGSSQARVIAAHGRVVLYIDGDVGGSDLVSFIVDPTGSLDVFVTGDFASSGGLRLGSPNYPALSRVYVGGAKVGGSGDSRFAGNVYAASADVGWSANADFYGSLIAGAFGASGDTRLHYDRQVLQVGNECGPSPSPAPGPKPMCTSAADCGNQPCKDGVCAPCTSSTDCPAPLTCEAGRCGIVVL